MSHKSTKIPQDIVICIHGKVSRSSSLYNQPYTNKKHGRSRFQSMELSLRDMKIISQFDWHSKSKFGVYTKVFNKYEVRDQKG